MNTDELVREATRLLRQHHRRPEDRGSLRPIAELFVDLRERFATSTGEPDWKGATAPYKAVVRKMFSDAGFDREERDRAQAGIRYHVGNILRERLTEEELDYLGLHRTTPRERHAAQRDTQAQLLASLRPSAGLEAPRPVDPLLGITGAVGLLQRVQDEDLGALSPVAERTVRRQLSTITAEVRRIRAALKSGVAPASA